MQALKLKDHAMPLGLFTLFQENFPYPVPDDIDRGIVMERIKEYNRDPDPRVGDYIIMLDGTYERFSYKWEDRIQTTTGGSFYLGSGYASFSGGLNPGIPLNKIVLTSERKEGNFWIFHHDYWTGHNGIGVRITVRVYQVIT